MTITSYSCATRTSRWMLRTFVQQPLILGGPLIVMSGPRRDGHAAIRTSRRLRPARPSAFQGGQGNEGGRARGLAGGSRRCRHAVRLETVDTSLQLAELVPQVPIGFLQPLEPLACAASPDECQASHQQGGARKDPRHQARYLTERRTALSRQPRLNSRRSPETMSPRVVLPQPDGP